MADTNNENQGTENQGTNGGGTENQGTENNQQQQKADATFTQEDLNRIGATEKAKGRQSALKELGFEDLEKAKADLAEYQTWKQSQKTAEEIQAEKLAAATTEKTKAEEAYQNLADKLTVLTCGVDKDSASDVLAIAKLRVTEDKDIETVLTEMKKEPKYAGFFTGTGGASGTGSATGNKRAQGSNGEAGSFGKRLAEQQIANNPKKSSFFNN